MADPNSDILAHLTRIEDKLDDALLQAARHDEQIKSLNQRGGWFGAIASAIIGFLLKDKLGL